MAAHRRIAWPTSGAAIPAGLLPGAVVFYISIPIVAVVLYSLATRWTTHVMPDGYTLTHWAYAAADRRFRDVLVLCLAVATGLIDLMLVVPAAYWQRVRNPRIRPVLELLAAIPFSIPFAVIAFGLLGLSNDYLPALQGTLWLLLPAHEPSHSLSSTGRSTARSRLLASLA